MLGLPTEAQNKRGWPPSPRATAAPFARDQRQRLAGSSERCYQDVWDSLRLSAPKARCRTARVGPANRPSAARISQGLPGLVPDQQTDRSERCYQDVWDSLRLARQRHAAGLVRRPRQQTKRSEDIAGTTGTRARSTDRPEQEMLPGRLGFAQASAPKARCRTACVGPANRPSAARISQGQPGLVPDQQTDRSERCYQDVWDSLRLARQRHAAGLRASAPPTDQAQRGYRRDNRDSCPINRPTGARDVTRTSGIRSG